VRDVWRALDERYPFAHRADWDNVGILLGDPDAPVRSILIALDATPAAVAACRRVRADVLVTHHPVVLRPLKALRARVPGEDAAYALVRLGTAVVSAHTNADAAPRGVSYVLARRLGLLEIVPLLPGEPAGACKIAVFVPPEHAGAVLAAVSGAGGARIGDYRDCSFRVAGTGTYRPLEGARPWRGRTGRLEAAEEVRLEAVVPRDLVPRVVRAVRAAHPYEEPAVDVVALEGGAQGGGVGALGEMRAPARLEEVLRILWTRLRPACLRVAGARREPVRRVAVVAGSGGEFAGAAREAGADLLVTGDVRYHQALEAAAAGIAVADVGHGAGERWILPEFRKALEERFGGAAKIRVHYEEEPLRPFWPGARRGGRS